MKVSNRRSRVIILSVLILCCAATYWSADKIDAADSSSTRNHAVICPEEQVFRVCDDWLQPGFRHVRYAGVNSWRCSDTVEEMNRAACIDEGVCHCPCCRNSAMIALTKEHDFTARKATSAERTETGWGTILVCRKCNYLTGSYADY